MKLMPALKLAYRLWKNKDSNLLRHASSEFDAVWKEQDAMQDLMKNQLSELIEVFSTHGHSGFSAGYAISCFETLVRYKPLGPLTGDDDEWQEVGDGVFQNRRCGRIFKQANRFDGQAYDINGKVFREPNGSCYTSSESMVPVTFPYTPTTEYVDVPAS